MSSLSDIDVVAQAAVRAKLATQSSNAGSLTLPRPRPDGLMRLGTPQIECQEDGDLTASPSRPRGRCYGPSRERLPSDEITGGATSTTPSMTMSAETATITTWAPSSSNLPMREGDGMDRHDLVVLGGGAAGITAAKTALALGASVALIDRGPLGGACINRG